MPQKSPARALRDIWSQASAERRFLKPLEKLLESQLKPGYCPQNAAKASGKGAAGHLKPG